MGAGRLLPWMNAVGPIQLATGGGRGAPPFRNALLSGLGAAAAGRSRCPRDQWPYPKKSHGEIERAAAASGNPVPSVVADVDAGQPEGGR
jgi:hypothetical protein